MKINSINDIQFNTLIGSTGYVQKEAEQQGLPKPFIEAKDNAAPAKENIPREDIQKMTDKLNRMVGLFGKNLKFEIMESRRVLVKIVDTKTGEIVNEVPPERLVKILDGLAELAGNHIDKKV